MSGLPQLTEADIRRWTGDESFRRGRRYFDQGAILNPCRVGMTLKAQCQGSRAQPYRVQITLGPKGIASGDCSCPVGGSGHCKHAAALLLTWLNDADAFADVEDMATTLDRRSKPELIDLIGKMVERYPDLEMLVELPVPGEATSKPVDAESIRRQIQRVLSSAGYEWSAASEVALDLGNVVDVGDGYVEREDWRNAAIVYETVIREVLDQYQTMQDEEGDLNEVVNRCVGGLGQYLSTTRDAPQCETILRALFDTYIWEMHQTPLSIQVAQAAEPSRPQESIRIYVDAARRLIQARGRHNYTTAAKYLSHVRKLYQRLGEDKTWQTLIADIRQQNSSLRAL